MGVWADQVAQRVPVGELASSTGIESRDEGKLFVATNGAEGVCVVR